MPPRAPISGAPLWDFPIRPSKKRRYGARPRRPDVTIWRLDGYARNRTQVRNRGFREFIPQSLPRRRGPAPVRTASELADVDHDRARRELQVVDLGHLEHLCVDRFPRRSPLAGWSTYHQGPVFCAVGRIQQAAWVRNVVPTVQKAPFRIALRILGKVPGGRGASFGGSGPLSQPLHQAV